jgi:hypothetical protein
LDSNAENGGPYWWEPNQPGVLDIGDIGVFLAALVAFSTVFMMVSRWWMKTLRRIINEEITVATQPIHPNANGGLSLADVARKANKLDERLEHLEQILEMAVALSQVEEVVEEVTPPKKPATRKTTRSTSTRAKKK